MKLRTIVCLGSLFLLLNPIGRTQISPAASRFVDSIVAQMSADEKIAQLFIIRSFSIDQAEQTEKVLSTLKRFPVGGICFFKGNSRDLVKLHTKYQAASKIPLLMTMDAEWGASMRLDDAIQYPKHLCLGAIENSELIYEMGRDMAEQLKRLGIHMNFAPCLDININPNNPVINERSFGDNPIQVARKAFAFMKGLQDGGVLACAKHFPGHGDTDVDSHFDLPTLRIDIRRLQNVEMLPFRAIHDKGLAAIMVAHLHIPALDSTPNIPASLSPHIVANELRIKMGFDGLIITDALEMKGVTKNFSPAEISLKAFKAGNDVLLLSEDLPTAVSSLSKALQNGEISMTDLDEKVKRILYAKYQLKLWGAPAPLFDAEYERHAQRKTKALVDKLYRHAFTIAKDIQGLIPIRQRPSHLLSISLGEDKITPFQNRLDDYANCKHLSFVKNIGFTEKQLELIKKADLVILTLHRLNYSISKNFGVNPNDISLLRKHLKHKRVILVIFGNPYIANEFNDFGSIALAYENTCAMQDIAAQLLFGSDPISGMAPVSLRLSQNTDKPIKRPTLHRLGFTIPEAVGMNSDSLDQISRLSEEMIQSKVTPGCQILVAKDRKIVFNKAYGFINYDATIPVQTNTFYDIASLTKIIATAPALMLLQDLKLFDPQKKFKEYFASFEGTNKDDLTFHDFLLHQGRLAPWIPFYKETLISPDTLNLINWHYYRKVQSDSFPTQVADSLFVRFDITDTIFQKILNSPRYEEASYRYSDVGFYFIPMLVSMLTGMPFEQFLRKNLYDPLHMENTAFNPLSKGIPRTQIAPTEVDNYFRHQTIHGYVHDMGAALMGGVSGHAGLFSTAKDVAQMMQLYLDRGNHGGNELISWGSMARYLDRDQKFKRRAWAFDMPSCDTSESPYISCRASPFTFGHQGFTGTCAWADPKEQLVYIFLSNRTYPTAGVNHLHRGRYRMKIHDVIYRSIIKS